MLEKIIHATNLPGIENLYNHEYSDTRKYICCSSMDCSDWMHRDVLFLLEGEVIERFSGDCGSDGHGNNIESRNTTYDELHVNNDYTIEGLYWDNRKNIELYAAAYSYIIYVLQKPCNIINAESEIETQIKNWADNMNDEELYSWLESCGIENLIV